MVVPLYFEESPALSGVSPLGTPGASLWQLEQEWRKTL